MSSYQRSTALYSTPFSKAYWKDAASEMKFTKMLIVTALMTALRIALKPLAIPIGPSLNIQTAMLATALGAMIFGPVVAIPAAIVSDTIGFLVWPTGDYFLPFVLTEIASTVIYALFLYRAKISPTRVMLSRFFICFLVNVVLQQAIYAWYYVYIGQPESAIKSLVSITTTARLFKNLFFFPLESVVMTLFLKVLVPVTNRAGLTFCKEADMRFTKKQIIALVCLTVIGVGSTGGYLYNKYNTSSRSADYTASQRVEINKEMTQTVLSQSNEWKDKTVVGIVDSAYRPLFGKETDYTVSIYVLDQDAFAAGQAADAKYTMDTLWGFSKSGPSKDKYHSLVKVATATFTKVEKTGEIRDFTLKPEE